MKVILVAGGPLSAASAELLRRESADFWVGVDGGARHFVILNRLPDCITGDFDTLTESEIEDFKGQGVQVVPTPDQDYTDIDKAIDVAISTHDATHIRIFGATGGQTDHFSSVLSALIKYQYKAHIRLIDEYGEVWVAKHFEELRGETLVGRLFSLIAMGEVTGITTTGLEWPLNHETLALGVRDGTRNRIIASTVTVQKQSGNLFLMLHY